MTNIDIYSLLKSRAKHPEFIQDYLDICSKLETGGENHHILPRAMFPEYKNLNITPFNSAKISRKSHLIAHWYLYKIFRNRECTHAFRMMLEKKKKISELTYEEIEKFAEIYSIVKLESNEFQSKTMTSKIQITNGIEYYYIDKTEQIPYGYYVGRISAMRSGEYIAVKNNTQQKFIKKEDKEIYLDNGWTPGQHGRKSYTNGIVTKHIDGQSPIPPGFILGSNKKYTPMLNPSKILGMASKKLGKRYYNNGELEIFCYPNETPLLYHPGRLPSNKNTWLPNNCIKLPRAWYRNINTGETKYMPNYIDYGSDWVSNKSGNKNTKNKIWIHYNDKSKMVYPDQVPTGWTLGRYSRN